ncbi:hypothetical protein BDV37DRAFT_288835 [Aspergillus pseudonomiae]|uniref:Uncharacterized protein n=1 Tax=Aspergillus pseudonomiae TaxID=1506151 RepID=A0A5N7CVE2_9EURO|nr:uncharacterized protein BDV37DRAFT_288835 [Aspergillus pseudonomiae]KAE8398124.1 hypothetical protein BDV37DRAFT_288835 [Aspergillus pseudonomiae]
MVTSLKWENYGAFAATCKDDPVRCETLLEMSQTSYLLNRQGGDNWSIAVFASHGDGSSQFLKSLRVVSRPFCYSATQILFQAVRLFQKERSDSDLEKRDDIQALLELAQSGASRYIRVMRVRGDTFFKSSDPSEGVEVIGTVAKAFRDYVRPRLERLELFEPNNLMLREFSHHAVAPIIAGLKYLTIWGCTGCPNSAEIRRILQSG